MPEEGRGDRRAVSLPGSAAFVEAGDFWQLIQGAKKKTKMPVHLSAGCTLTADTASSSDAPIRAEGSVVSS